LNYDPIVDYLTKHGDMPASRINIPGMSLAAIKTRVLSLYRAGVLLRRQEPVSPSSRKMNMIYSLSGLPAPAKPNKNDMIDKEMRKVLKREPEYSYHLRNLPRDQNGFGQDT
jgi:hypothetical protein